MAASTTFQAVGQLGFDKAQLDHLDSQIADIALDLRPNTRNYINGDGELRIGSQGSFAVRPDGRWHDFEEGVGGRGAITETTHLMDGAAPTEVRRYLAQRLAMPRGTFAANPISDAEQEKKDAANAAYADEVLHRMDTVTATNAAGKNLGNFRKLDIDQLRDCGVVAHLETGRDSESAVVGILTDSASACVGVQLGHITIDGARSVYEPVRNQYLRNKEQAKDGAFRIAASPIPEDSDIPDIVRALAGTVIVVEGLEDALTAHQSFPVSEVWGLPGGIGRLQHMKKGQKGTKFCVLADGDGPDSAARKSLIKGVDALIIAGAQVQLAMSPPGEDANSLLQAGGVEAVRAVVATAVPAVLSPKGIALKASRMSQFDYAQVRRKLAKEAGVGGPALDAERNRLRQQNQPQEDNKPAWATWDESLWPAPITDIAGVCDTALNEVKRYVFGHGDELAIVVMWCLLAHFVHHGIIKLAVCPRLAIKAISYRCGKTTLLEAVENLVPRPESHGGAMSEATFRHLVDEHRVSVLIDEADSLFRRHSKDGHLLGMLRSGHRRSTAHTMHMEPSPDGRGWSLHRASTWAALAYTQIGRLFDSAMEDRALSVHLQRARPGEVTAHLVDGASPELRLIRQKFARWAADQTAMPDIAQPDQLYNRDGDNWMPLLRLAHLIGGQWPNLIMSAALRAVGRNEPDIGFSTAGLLHDIREVFGEREQILSGELVAKLPTLEEQRSDWSTVAKGRPINTSWLAEKLSGVETGRSPGETIHPGPLEGERGRHGYTRAQFADAWSRYLSPKGEIFAAAPEPPLTPFTGFTPSPPYRGPAIHPETPQSKREGVNPVNPVKGDMRPSAHIFPDGQTTPFDVDPAPAAPDEAPKEELW